MSCSAF